MKVLTILTLIYSSWQKIDYHSFRMHAHKKLNSFHVLLPGDLQSSSCLIVGSQICSWYQASIVTGSGKGYLCLMSWLHLTWLFCSNAVIQIFDHCFCCRWLKFWLEDYLLVTLHSKHSSIVLVSTWTWNRTLAFSE